MGISFTRFRLVLTILLSAFACVAQAMPNEAEKFETIANGCPVTEHDIIVSDIQSLRHAAHYSPSGTVIGVSGSISINDDAGGNVVVGAKDIEITCASDDAEIRGQLGGQLNQALVRIVADNVKVSWLRLTADDGSGIWSTAERTGVERSEIGCEFACIAFVGAANGRVNNNRITSGSRFVGAFGIAAVNGAHNVQIKNNFVENCSSCISVQDAVGAFINGNRLKGECFFTCAQLFKVTDTKFTNNDCDSYGIYLGQASVSNCLRLSNLSDNVTVANNKLRGLVNLFGSPIDKFVFRNNRVLDAHMVAIDINHSVIERNDFDNCGVSFFDGARECLTVAGSNVDVVDNTFTTARAPIVIYARNGNDSCRENCTMPSDSVTINGNEVDTSGSTTPHTGIRLQASNSYVADNQIELAPGIEAIGISVTGFEYIYYAEVGGVVQADAFSRGIARDNYVGQNTIRGGSIGVKTTTSCLNTFEGNDVDNIGPDQALELFGKIEQDYVDPWTGENVFLRFSKGGTGANTVVVDDATGEPGSEIVETLPVIFGQPATLVGDGYIDCDGDGATDPNFIVESRRR